MGPKKEIKKAASPTKKGERGAESDTTENALSKPFNYD